MSFVVSVAKVLNLLSIISLVATSSSSVSSSSKTAYHYNYYHDNDFDPVKYKGFKRIVDQHQLCPRVNHTYIHYQTLNGEVFCIDNPVERFPLQYEFFLQEMANPFELNFPKIKKTLTRSDLQMLTKEFPKVEQRLQSIFKHVNFTAHGLAHHGDFFARTSTGIKQVLIGPSNSIKPQKLVWNIGGTAAAAAAKSKRCIVTGCKLARDSSEKCMAFLNETVHSLQHYKYQGRLIANIRTFLPNPTGREAKLIATPYAVKLFMIYDAHLTDGCDSVLWIDNSMLPIADLNPLFEHVEKKTGFVGIYCYTSGRGYAELLLPAARLFMYYETGVDVLSYIHISCNMLGFDFRRPLIHEFMTEFYRLAALGHPFLSCFPEEFVLSAILFQSRFISLLPGLSTWENSRMIHDVSGKDERNNASSSQLLLPAAAVARGHHHHNKFFSYKSKKFIGNNNN
jgi:hypothetical protein